MSIDKELRKKVLELEFTITRMAQAFEDIGIAVTIHRNNIMTCGKCGRAISRGQNYDCPMIDCMNGFGPEVV
jgi:hypothetical protein